MHVIPKFVLQAFPYMCSYLENIVKKVKDSILGTSPEVN
jgi:hypothetical protein